MSVHVFLCVSVREYVCVYMCSCVYMSVGVFRRVSVFSFKIETLAIHFWPPLNKSLLSSIGSQTIFLHQNSWFFFLKIPFRVTRPYKYYVFLIFGSRSRGCSKVNWDPRGEFSWKLRSEKQIISLKSFWR